MHVVQFNNERALFNQSLYIHSIQQMCQTGCELLVLSLFDAEKKSVKANKIYHKSGRILVDNGANPIRPTWPNSTVGRNPDSEWVFKPEQPSLDMESSLYALILIRMMFSLFGWDSKREASEVFLNSSVPWERSNLVHWKAKMSMETCTTKDWTTSSVSLSESSFMVLGRHRWVEYAGWSWRFDYNQVAPQWLGWLASLYDEVPSEVPTRNGYEK